MFRLILVSIVLSRSYQPRLVLFRSKRRQFRLQRFTCIVQSRFNTPAPISISLNSRCCTLISFNLQLRPVGTVHPLPPSIFSPVNPNLLRVSKIFDRDGINKYLYTIISPLFSRISSNFSNVYRYIVRAVYERINSGTRSTMTSYLIGFERSPI